MKIFFILCLSIMTISLGVAIGWVISAKNDQDDDEE
jgi:hypothetical protein